MHLFILAMFGPAGHNWNNIIWPWTAAMALFDIVLFAGKVEFSLREIAWTQRHGYHAAVLILFAILPLLSFFKGCLRSIARSGATGPDCAGAAHVHEQA